MKRCLVQPRYRGEGHCHTSKGCHRICPLPIENFTLSGEGRGVVCEDEVGRVGGTKVVGTGIGN